MPTLVRRTLLALLLTVACNSANNTPRAPSATGGSGGGSSGGSGGVVASGGSGGAASGGSGGTISGTPDVGAPAPVVDASPAPLVDAAIDMSVAPVSDGGGTDGYPDSDFLTGRPDIRLCKKEWTAEQCCAFLGSCLNTICKDSAKAKAGLDDWMTWCPKLSDMARRCHVYHCYISISPTGGINDHDSHCGHAANQVQGGGCPTTVYQ